MAGRSGARSGDGPEAPAPEQEARRALARARDKLRAARAKEARAVERVEEDVARARRRAEARVQKARQQVELREQRVRVAEERLSRLTDGPAERSAPAGRRSQVPHAKDEPGSTDIHGVR